MAKGNSEGFDLGSVALRMVFSMALVFLTFNPTGHSYFHWLRDHVSPLQPQVVVAGIVLLGAWLFFIRATFTSMGTVGVVLLLALFGAIIWWMVSAGLLSTTDRSSMAWVVLLCLGLLLGFGMSWAHIRSRISGQASVDRVDQ
jgi:nucleoside recognition membrane protein YjiH